MHVCVRTVYVFMCVCVIVHMLFFVPVCCVYVCVRLCGCVFTWILMCVFTKRRKKSVTKFCKRFSMLSGSEYHVTVIHL